MKDRICKLWWCCTHSRPHPKDGEGNVFSLFTPRGGGYPGQVRMGVPWPGWGTPSPSRDGGTPCQGWVPSPGIGQQMEYLIRGGRYTSCVHCLVLDNVTDQCQNKSFVFSFVNEFTVVIKLKRWPPTDLPCKHTWSK